MHCVALSAVQANADRHPAAVRPVTTYPLPGANRLPLNLPIGGSDTQGPPNACLPERQDVRTYAALHLRQDIAKDGHSGLQDRGIDASNKGEWVDRMERRDARSSLSTLRASANDIRFAKLCRSSRHEHWDLTARSFELGSDYYTAPGFFTARMA